MIRHEYRYDVQSMTHAERRTFNVWKSMKARCRCDRNPAFKWYGGRGIDVCDRWHDDFIAFVADVGIPSDIKLQLDRIDNNRGYEPGNCRWTTRRINMRNYRRNVHIEINGVTKVACDWADEHGIDRQTFYSRLRQGVKGPELLAPAVKYIVEIDGVTRPAYEWAKTIPIGLTGFLHRYRIGWRGKKLLEPSQKKKRAAIATPAIVTEST